MTPEQNQKLNTALVNALASVEKQQATTRVISVRKDTAGIVEPGDLLIIATPEPIAAWWCAVFSHSENNELWFMVPGDEFSLCGSADWPVPQTPIGGQLNFRCGCGVWAHVNDLMGATKCGQLDYFHTEAVRDRIGEIAESRLAYNAENVEVDESHDYQEWLSQVQAAADSWSDFIEASNAEPEATVYLANTANEDWIARIELQVSLAAADVETSSEAAKGLIVQHDGSGTLVALVDDEGVQLRLSGADRAPRVFCGEFKKRSVSWSKYPGCEMTELLPWDEGAVFLLIGTKKFVIQR